MFDEKIDEQRAEMITVLQNLVKINSVEGKPEEGKPFGSGPATALGYFLKTAENMGFRTANVDGYVGYAEWGTGSEYVGILGHLDVVPEGNDWHYPPFGAEIHDDRLYGRGSLDDKGPVVAALYALYALKQQKVKLSKRVRLIVGVNEESGCKDIPHYLEQEQPPVAGFTPDAQFPVIYAEKGIMHFTLTHDQQGSPQQGLRLLSIRAGQAVNVVPNYCEAQIQTDQPEALLQHCQAYAHQHDIKIEAERQNDTVVIKSYGVAAHASMPQLGKNAAMQMLSVLATLNFSEPIKHFFSNAVRLIGMEVDGQSLGIAMEDQDSGKLSLNVGVISGDDRQIRMRCDIRHPVSGTQDELLQKLNVGLQGTGLIIEDVEYHKPLYFAKDHPLIQILRRVYEQQTGRKEEPIAVGGGTYAKDMPNIVAFGPQHPGAEDRCHQADEYMDLNELLRITKIYAHAMYELAK